MKQGGERTKNIITRNLIAGSVQIANGYIVSFAFGLAGIIGGVNSGLKTQFDAVMVTILLAFMAIGVLQIVRGKKRKKLITLFKDTPLGLPQIRTVPLTNWRRQAQRLRQRRKMFLK